MVPTEMHPPLPYFIALDFLMKENFPLQLKKNLASIVYWIYPTSNDILGQLWEYYSDVFQYSGVN